MNLWNFKPFKSSPATQEMICKRLDLTSRPASLSRIVWNRHYLRGRKVWNRHYLRSSPPFIRCPAFHPKQIMRNKEGSQPFVSWPTTYPGEMISKHLDLKRPTSLSLPASTKPLSKNVNKLLQPGKTSHHLWSQMTQQSISPETCCWKVQTCWWRTKQSCPMSSSWRT